MIDLKNFRKDNKLTQTELGDYLGIGKSFISRIEKGEVALPGDKLSKLLRNTQGWVVDALVMPQPSNSNTTNLSFGDFNVTQGENSSINSRNKGNDPKLLTEIATLKNEVKHQEEKIKHLNDTITQLKDQLKDKERTIGILMKTN